VTQVTPFTARSWGTGSFLLCARQGVCTWICDSTDLDEVKDDILKDERRTSNIERPTSNEKKGKGQS